MIIRANIHSDDNAKSATFNASPWFAEASDEDIVAFARTDFGRKVSADMIARTASVWADDVKAVLEHCADMVGLPTPVGFQRNIVTEDALLWIDANRHHLLQKAEELSQVTLQEKPYNFSCKRSHTYEGTLWIVRNGIHPTFIQDGLREGILRMAPGAEVGFPDLPHVIVDGSDCMIGYLEELSPDAGKTTYTEFQYQSSKKP